MDLKEKIIAYGKQLGLPIIRITSPDPLQDVETLLEERGRAGYLSGWEPKQVDPSLLLPAAKSVICAALPYHLSHGAEEENRGYVSKSSWGVDYHRVLTDKLNQLLGYIKELQPEGEGIVCVDTKPVIDRVLAQRSGLGFFGKNNSLITRDYGSWVFLGEIITNVELPYDQPIDDQCGECRICLDHCPTGALVSPYCLNASRCLAYLSQKKGHISEELRQALGNQLYGCDICQQVCPRNKEVKPVGDEAFSQFEELRTPDLLWLLEMDKREFQNHFGQIAAGWRGRTTLQRNAIIALVNRGMVEAVPALRQKLRDERPVIRGYAVWALGKLLGRDSVDLLQKHLQIEKNEKIRKEIENTVADFM